MRRSSNFTAAQQKDTRSVTAGVLQRKCSCGQHAGGECEECKKKKQSLQRRRNQETDPSEVPPVVHEVLRSAAPPLDVGTRRFMEPRFGQDFSHVRVHTGGRAAHSAQAVGALAYTVGRDVVFGSGQYAPETPQGRELLAHELTHVVQQSGAPAGGSLRIDQDAGAEREADARARSALLGEPLAPAGNPGNIRQGLQRTPLPADMRDLDAPHGPRGSSRSGSASRFLDCVEEGGEASRQRCREAHLGVPPEPKFGTAETTAPVASNEIKPQRVMLDELNDEVALFNAAQVILQWAGTKQSALASTPASPGSSPGAAPAAFAFSAADLFADKKAIKKIKPVPKAEIQLVFILDLLVFYGTLSAPTAAEPKYVLQLDAATGTPATEAFTEAKTDTAKFTKDFQKRVKKEDPLAPVVSTGQIPKGWSSDHKQVRAENEAEANLADLKMQLGEFLVILPPLGRTKRKPITRATTDVPTPVTDTSGATIAWEIPVAGASKPVRFRDPFEVIEKVADGTHPETVKLRDRIEKDIKKAEADLRVKGRYRTFADEVIVLLNRLRARNTTWTAGTYVGHSWGEFSIDVFFNVSFDPAAPGFWKRSVVRTFFDDLNAAAEEDDGAVGKFAWRALYNDDPLATEINKKYGARRILHVPHHGPAPDKLHIHLDVTPVDLRKDEVTGYEIVNGRVRILKP